MANTVAVSLDGIIGIFWMKTWTIQLMAHVDMLSYRQYFEKPNLKGQMLTRHFTPLVQQNALGGGGNGGSRGAYGSICCLCISGEQGNTQPDKLYCIKESLENWIKIQKVTFVPL